MSYTSKIAILGSTSFIGAHFARYAAEEGSEILRLDRSNGYNLNENLAGILGALDGFKPDTIVNFVAEAKVEESFVRPDEFIQTNVVSQCKLQFELVKRMHYLKKYLRFSTPEVYGSSLSAIKEGSPFNPSSPYAVSRAADDSLLMVLHKTYGFPVVFTRAANVYGINQGLNRLIPKAILASETGTPFPLEGYGETLRSFIHIYDVCRGVMSAIRHGLPGEVFHFATDKLITTNRVLSEISMRMGKKILIDHRSERPGKDFCYSLDCTQTRDRLNWHPKWDLLDEGLSNVISWLRFLNKGQK